MMTALLRSRNRRWLAAAAAIALLAAGLGVLAARLTADEGAPPLGVTSNDVAAAGPNGEPVVVTADPAVEFPASLGGLANPPTHLAVDPKTGDLWFMIFTYDGVSNTLYHYSPLAGSVETFAIPSSTGSELFSAIGIDARGHVISAEGSVVTDFDPASKFFTQVRVEQPTTPTARYSPADGTSILDMAVGEGSVLYLSRMNVPAITELDLSTGKTRELPYPAEFGPAYDIELGRDGLWMTSRWNIETISSAQTGLIDVATGAFTTAGGGTTALATAPGGDTLGVRASTPEAPAPDLVRVTANGLAPLPFASASGKAGAISGLGILDNIAVDQKTGATWFTGQGSGSIFRVDTGTGVVREYKLPAYKGFVPRCPEGVPCPSNGNLATHVRGLAVVPNGDLYFADATLNRIGVIHAGQ